MSRYGSCWSARPRHLRPVASEPHPETGFQAALLGRWTYDDAPGCAEGGESPRGEGEGGRGKGGAHGGMCLEKLTHGLSMVVVIVGPGKSANSTVLYPVHHPGPSLVVRLPLRTRGGTAQVPGGFPASPEEG